MFGLVFGLVDTRDEHVWNPGLVPVPVVAVLSSAIVIISGSDDVAIIIAHMSAHIEQGAVSTRGGGPRAPPTHMMVRREEGWTTLQAPSSNQGPREHILVGR